MASGLTFSQITSLAQTYLRSDNTDITNNLSTWCQMAQVQICFEARWTWSLQKDVLSLTNAVGTGPYTLSAAMAFPARSALAYPALEELPWDQFTLYQAMAAGPPKVFSRVPGAPTQILVAPVPDTTYSLSFAYHKILPDLVNPGDTNYLTTYYPQILTAATVIEGFWYLGALQDLQAWLKRFRADMRRMAAKELDAADASTYTPRMFADYETLKQTDAAVR
jgi:hypothetical protein